MSFMWAVLTCFFKYYSDTRFPEEFSFGVWQVVCWCTMASKINLMIWLCWMTCQFRDRKVCLFMLRMLHFITDQWVNEIIVITASENVFETELKIDPKLAVEITFFHFSIFYFSKFRVWLFKIVMNLFWSLSKSQFPDH